MNIKIKNRALSHVGNGYKPFLQTLQVCGGSEYCMDCSPLYGLSRDLQTVLRCRDCSPNSPKRKAARSGTAPYSLGASERFETVPYSHDAAERFETVPYRLIAAERLQTVPYRLYKLADEVDIVGTVPRCMDCSPL